MFAAKLEAEKLKLGVLAGLWLLKHRLRKRVLVQKSWDAVGLEFGLSEAFTK
jgi:hypothetical protein